MISEKDIIICGHGSGFPSIKKMYNYLENRHKLLAPNGIPKGLISVRRIKSFTAEQQQQFHDAYKSILGRNYYSQNLRQYVFKSYNGRYYSDCSSSGDACYAKAGHNVGWLNTAGIYNSKYFEDVPVFIKNGHVQNPDILQVGDALLFVGDDPDRPLQIGHVEFIYEIPPQKETWKWIECGDKWYYQNQDGVNKHGWAKIKETYGKYYHWYYFANNGEMLTGNHWINEHLCLFMPMGPLKGAMCVSDENGYQTVWNLDK